MPKPKVVLHIQHEYGSSAYLCSDAKVAAKMLSKWVFPWIPDGVKAKRGLNSWQDVTATDLYAYFAEHEDEHYVILEGLVEITPETVEATLA